MQRQTQIQKERFNKNNRGTENKKRIQSITSNGSNTFENGNLYASGLFQNTSEGSFKIQF